MTNIIESIIAIIAVIVQTGWMLLTTHWLITILLLGPLIVGIIIKLLKKD